MKRQMGGVLLDPTTGRPEDILDAHETKDRNSVIPPHIEEMLELAKMRPGLKAMARQYFREQQEPIPTADFTAVTAAAATLWWAPATWTPINFPTAKSTQTFSVCAWGVITTTATPGTLILDPRIATTAGGGVSLGASTAVALPASQAAVPWYLEMWVQFRQARNDTASSTVGSGVVRWNAGVTSQVSIIAGGALATTIDTSVSTGIAVVGTFSVATGSLTPRGLIYEICN